MNRRVGHVIEQLAAGEDEAGAKLFVETVARRPGAWEQELPAELREVFTQAAHRSRPAVRRAARQHR